MTVERAQLLRLWSLLCDARELARSLHAAELDGTARSVLSLIVFGLERETERARRLLDGGCR